MTKRQLLLAFAFTASLAAQTASRDMCAPPPGSVPPSLPAKLLSGQGPIDFPITTKSAEAQKFFNQGVAQMHSFWATVAERSFLQAAALDPEAPMPQWGIAMVAAGDYRPRFQLVRDAPAPTKKAKAAAVPRGSEARAIEAAKKALELSKVPGKATELEKLYIASIVARRTSTTPDEDYIKGLRAIAAAHPNEVEAKTYLALHLMSGFTTPEMQPRPGSMEAIEILRDLLKAAPDHMGVHHYVIHGWEGSTIAKEAWESCRRYPQLVTNIPHALHMPGHIWAQTGKWQEAVESFEAAAANERGYMKANSLYGAGHHGHNVHFLVSSYAFLGQYDKAMENARELLAMQENPREASQVDNFRTAYRQGWFAMMLTLVHAEKWDQILDGTTLPLYDKPRERAWRHWAEGLAHAAKGDVKSAKADAKQMARAMKDLKKAIDQIPPPLAVAQAELDGHIAFAAGKTDRSLATLETAVKQERALRYNEPPSYPRPVAQVLGQFALKAGKPELAEAAFRQALQQYPGFGRASAGLTEVARLTGKSLAAAPALRSEMLVSTDWLAQRLSDPKLVVLHVSRDRKVYDAGHIPGARFLAFSDLVTVRNGVTNELPPAADLLRVLEQAGVSDDSRVVLYGDVSVLPATRAYFTLDYLGHGDHVSLLDGGLQKWSAESRPLSKEEPAAQMGRFTPRPRPEVVVGVEAVKDLSWAASNKTSQIPFLLDVRPAEQYLGTSANESANGHIPGAVNLYWVESQVSSENPALQAEPELRKLFESAGLTPDRPVVTYCGSGVQATQTYFALKYLGYDVSMYDGSFSEWIKTDGTTVEK
jgi:thiosulfate/3-mercaptopyruvate sulfurtransferase